jgi:hypothetical protein
MSAHAQPPSQETTGTTSAPQVVSVRVEQPSPTVSATGELQADVVSDLTSDAEYFEVRFRLKNADGRLLYQKTEVRHNIKAGSQTIRFSRALQDLSLQQGRYPIEVRVLATGSQATEMTSRLLVLDGTPPTVPVVIAVRLTCSPGVDPSGRFLADPAVYPEARTDAERLADIVSAHPSLKLSLAISPLLLEEWQRAADGYETSGPEGIKEFPESSPGATGSRRVLDRMKTLLGGGRTTLLDVPYAEPDLAGLAAIDGIADLDGQWSMTDSVIKSAVGSEVSSGTAFLGDDLPADALPALERRGVSFALLEAASVRSGNATAGPGVYTLGDSDVRALVYDSRPVRAAAEDRSDDFYDVLFSRATAADPGEPLVLRFEIGPGTRDTLTSFERSLDWLAELPWVTIVDATDAAAYAKPREGQLVRQIPARGAPAGYWSDVAEARSRATAASQALGPDDPDARAALTAVYVAESLCWAGPDRKYALADRGRAFAASATRYVDDLFAAVTIGARDVTLSNRTGQVPVSVVNGTGKPLKLTLVTSAGRVTVGASPRSVSLDAGENVLTIPVDMGSELTDTLNIRLVASDLVIREATVRVQASYLDRLATLGMVLAFMVGLLWFIRRRVRNAGAGTMPEESSDE